MSFVPGDIVTHKNKNTEYRIEISPKGNLVMRHQRHAMTYSLPIGANRLVKIRHDTTYRVPKDNVDEYVRKTPEVRMSPAMLMFCRSRTIMPSTKLRHAKNYSMGVDGLDALRMAHDSGVQATIGRDFTEDFLKYAMRDVKFTNELNNKGEKKMSIIINSTVAKVFKDIETAALVTKYLGHEYKEEWHKDFIALKANKDAVLKEAKRLDDLAIQAACATK